MPYFIAVFINCSAYPPLRTSDRAVEAVSIGGVACEEDGIQDRNTLTGAGSLLGHRVGGGQTSSARSLNSSTARPDGISGSPAPRRFNFTQL